MGALTFKPSAGSRKESAEPLQMKAMVEVARKLMRGDLSNDVAAQAALANIIQVGTSAGGARAKAVVAWNESTNELRSGQFDVPEGFEHWLLKFDGVGKDLELGTGGNYGRIEYAYHLMAKAAGITMERCRLFEENGRAHFMTRRFDRDGNARHHIQSLCAMAHLDYKQRATHSYEQLFNTIASLELGDKALDQAFRRMVLNVIASNNDDHTKNFAFRLKQGGEWELAPAYDITHAYNPKGEWTYQHLMSVNGKFVEIRRADMLEVAERYLVPDAKDILDQVEAACGDWLSFATEAGLPNDEIARVGADIHNLS
jgi:serine/threonine-protein kinase HipA